jgi:nicotinamide-nucleotide amidase
MADLENARAVLDAARRRGWMIATAESCTGGLIFAQLTEIAGSSDVMDRGFVTYSNAAKHDMLGVPAKLIDQFGAVSEPVAQAMAEGALDRSGADVAISVTGVAGPGASEAKPEGMVCFALAMTGRPTRTETQQFGAIGRAKVRQNTVEHALKSLLIALN